MDIDDLTNSMKSLISNLATASTDNCSDGCLSTLKELIQCANQISLNIQMRRDESARLKAQSSATATSSSRSSSVVICTSDIETIEVDSDSDDVKQSDSDDSGQSTSTTAIIKRAYEKGQLARQKRGIESSEEKSKDQFKKGKLAGQKRAIESSEEKSKDQSKKWKLGRQTRAIESYEKKLKDQLKKRCIVKLQRISLTDSSHIHRGKALSIPSNSDNNTSVQSSSRPRWQVSHTENENISVSNAKPIGAYTYDDYRERFADVCCVQ